MQSTNVSLNGRGGPPRWSPLAVGGLAVAAGFIAGRRRSGGGVAGPVEGPSAAAFRSPLEPQSRAELLDVLHGRRFRPVFQPVFSLQDGRLLSVEALTRFEPLDHARSPLPVPPPNIWFRRAGELGLGVELELAAIDAALAASTGMPLEIPMSLNASPVALVDPRLEAVLDTHPRREVILEVTEHAIVGDYPELRRAVDRLRDRGRRLAVDDAGAGFASLRHVVRLAPDVIKLDASLTQGINEDPMRRALAASLILFARRTESQLVAEGIECAKDLAAWQELGADGAQGFLLARPGPLQAWDVGPTLVRSSRARSN